MTVEITFLTMGFLEPAHAIEFEQVIIYLEESVEARKGLVTFPQHLFAEVKEVDKRRVHSEQGINMLQHHVTNAAALLPVAQLLL